MFVEASDVIALSGTGGIINKIREKLQNTHT
jgi:hypothetical protein